MRTCNRTRAPSRLRSSEPASRSAGGRRLRSRLQPPSPRSFLPSSRWHVWRAVPLVSYAGALVTACGWCKREMFHVNHLYVHGDPMPCCCSSAGSRGVVTAARKIWGCNTGRSRDLQTRKGSESADPKLETAEPKSRKRKIKIVESQKLETQTERIRDRRTGRSVDRKTEKAETCELEKPERVGWERPRSASREKGGTCRSEQPQAAEPMEPQSARSEGEGYRYARRRVFRNNVLTRGIR